MSEKPTKTKPRSIRTKKGVRLKPPHGPTPRHGPESTASSTTIRNTPITMSAIPAARTSSFFRCLCLLARVLDYRQPLVRPFDLDSASVGRSLSVSARALSEGRLPHKSLKSGSRARTSEWDCLRKQSPHLRCVEQQNLARRCRHFLVSHFISRLLGAHRLCHVLGLFGNQANREFTPRD